MKFSFIYLYFLLSILLVFFLLFSCDGFPQPGDNVPTTQAQSVQPAVAEKRNPSDEFRAYWYQGLAEVNTYRLTQARYGELRAAEASLIFVTEPFRRDSQVKADRPSETDLSVLKLNSVKKYLTGVYPYSIMESTFSPVFEKSLPLKNTLTVQEWCGQVFVQINNREKLEVRSFSYFESEGDQELSLPKDYLESGIWGQIRLNPSELPTGSFRMIPSLEYSRLKHREIKAYDAVATLVSEGIYSVYQLEYPELGRTLVIRFETAFPHGIAGWEDTYRDGNAVLTSSARLNRRMLLPYWQLNQIKDSIYRDSLGLTQ